MSPTDVVADYDQRLRQPLLYSMVGDDQRGTMATQRAGAPPDGCSRMLSAAHMIIAMAIVDERLSDAGEEYAIAKSSAAVLEMRVLNRSNRP